LNFYRFKQGVPKKTGQLEVLELLRA